MPFIFFLIFFNRIDSKNKKAFFLYTFVITILVIAVVITRYIYSSGEGYFLVVRIYNVLEYSLLAFLFYLYIRNRLVRNFLLFTLIPYTVFCIYDFIDAKGPALALKPLIVEYLALLLFIIYFFFEVMQHNYVEPIYKKAIFWISVAFIINFSGNFFLLLASVNSYGDNSFMNLFLIINGTITILKNVLLSIAVTIKEDKIEDNSFDPLHFDSDLDTFLTIKNPK